MSHLRLFVQYNCNGCAQQGCKGFLEGGSYYACAYGISGRVCRNHDLRMEAITGFLKKVNYQQWLDRKNGKKNKEKEGQTAEA